MARSTSSSIRLIAWLVVTAAASTASAAEADDEPLRPPPGTPGSTAVPAAPDTLRPPPGTPGSTAAPAPPGPRHAPSEPPRPVAAPQPARPAAERGDRFQVNVSSRTYLRLFQRRYLMGMSETASEQESLVPVYEYAALRVDDVDMPWQRDAFDARLSAWGMLHAREATDESRLTGDLTAANARARFGPVYVSLGRQIAAAGAARFTRFDGVSAGFRLKEGISLDGYAGASVAPRFASRPEYVLLGSRADSLLRSPTALPSAGPTSFVLGGGRLGYSRAGLGSIGASLHEERDRGNPGRRWAALDLSATPVPALGFGGFGAFDAVSGRLAEARGWADVTPPGPALGTLSVLRSDPSLLLSRNSVLSVFSLDTFTEAGAEVTVRALRALSLGALAYHQWFSDSGAGNRVGATMRATFGRRNDVVTQLRYARVTEPVSGYHNVRASASYAFGIPLDATAEVYAYRYDTPIRGEQTSTVGSATLEYGVRRHPWRVMLGGFAARTPYAQLETQALARFGYDFDYLATGGAP